METMKYLKEYDCFVSKNGDVYQNEKKIKTFLVNGYKIANLKKDGKRLKISIHRLVAFAFIEKVEGKTHVDHIDGNKQNNCSENLHWCTVLENLNFDNVNRIKKIIPVKRIDKYGNVKEFENILDACHENWQQYPIKQVCEGKRKSYLGYKWQYLK